MACERTLDAMCGQLLAQMRTSGHCPPRAAGGGSGSDGAIIGDLRYPLVAFRLELAAGIPAGYSAVAAAATRTTAWFAGSLMMVRGELCSLIAKCRTQQPKFSRCKQGRNSQDQSPERKHKPTVLWSTKMQARASGDRRTRALEVVMTGYFREATEINRHFIHACSRGPLGMVHIVRGRPSHKRCAERFPSRSWILASVAAATTTGARSTAKRKHGVVMSGWMGGMQHMLLALTAGVHGGFLGGRRKRTVRGRTARQMQQEGEGISRPLHVTGRCRGVALATRCRRERRGLVGCGSHIGSSPSWQH